jgi:colanic acid/amylovoran biosynthesis glycosyltransferase
VEDGVSGFLVPERDEEALARRIIHLLDCHERWPKMGRRGREKVEADHNSATLNRGLEDIYRRVREEL